MTLESYYFSDIFNKESFFGRYSEDVVFAQFSVSASDSFGRKSEPSSSTSIAVVHQKFALFIPDFGVVGGNTLIQQSDMRFFSLTDPHSVVVLENSSIWRLIFWFFELKFNHSFVHILHMLRATFLTMTTLIYTS